MIKTVEAPELPKLDDEFASQFGIGDGGIDALRSEVRKNMEARAEKRCKRQSESSK